MTFKHFHPVDKPYDQPQKNVRYKLGILEKKRSQKVQNLSSESMRNLVLIHENFFTVMCLARQSWRMQETSGRN